MKPGIHYGMSMREYLAIPAVSAGVLSVLLERCPAAAWYCSPFNPRRPTNDDTDGSDAGTIGHAVFLEGSRDCIAEIDPRDHPAEKTGNIPDGWTNKSIRAARDAARASGKIPVLTADVAEIDALVCEAHAYVETLRNTEPAIWATFQPDGGTSETVMIWQEGETLCKLRADRISKDFAVICDYKTTIGSAEPEGWARTNLDYFGAAWYRRGVRAVTGVDPVYQFLVGERKPPYLHSMPGIVPADIALGDEMVGAALREWQDCERAHHWPGYPSRVAYCESPPWHRLRWEERNGVDAHGIPYDISRLFDRTDA